MTTEVYESAYLRLKRKNNSRLTASASGDMNLIGFIPVNKVCTSRLYPQIRNMAVPRFGISRIHAKSIQENGKEKKRLCINGALFRPILKGSDAAYIRTMKKAIVTSSRVLKLKNRRGSFSPCSGTVNEPPLTSTANAVILACCRELITSGVRTNLAILNTPPGAFSFIPRIRKARMILCARSREYGRNFTLMAMTKPKARGSLIRLNSLSMCAGCVLITSVEAISMTAIKRKDCTSP